MTLDSIAADTKQYDTLLDNMRASTWWLPAAMIGGYALYNRKVTRKAERLPWFVKAPIHALDGLYAAFVIGRLPAEEQEKAAEITQQQDRAWLYSVGNEVVASALMAPGYIAAANLTGSVIPVAIPAAITLTRLAYVALTRKPLAPISPETIVYKAGSVVKMVWPTVSEQRAKDAAWF